MRQLLIVVFAVLVVLTSAAHAKPCEIERWKRDRLINPERAHVYGRVAKGSATMIFIELWKRRKLIGESWTYINPRGVFDIEIYAKERISKKVRLRFSCR